MKTSLKKLQKFAALKHEKRSQKQHQPVAQDELAGATQAMNDMRDCYDRLLSAAAATANSAYEFSESLREMGDCLLEKTALNDDEDSGKVLLMLGKVQFQLQRLVDGYEMKKRCDGKREIYEDLLKKQKEKGRLKNSKGECFPSHHLQEAHEEYDEEANVFIFRMKSLKQGQSRSLLTQASRHHAAQLCFFKKALTSLETIEPHVKLVAVKQHIDYQFSGLKDDEHKICDDDDDDDDDDESDSGRDDDTEDDSESRDNGELSFDYGKNGPSQEVSTSKNSMELEYTDAAFSADLKLGAPKENLRSPGRNSFSFQREVRGISKSAPLFPGKKLDPAERLTKMRPSPSRKFTSYVLPTPDETKSPSSGKLYNEAPQTRQATLNLWHSSPLGQNKYEKLQANEKLSGSIILGTQSVLKESNNNTKASRLPLPLSEGHSFKQPDPSFASYAKKAKRQAFSGPLTEKPWPNNPNFSASGPIVSSAYPTPPFSGPLLRNPLPRPKSTPKLSSPPFVSSPKISELHELPRPPAHLTSRRPSNRSAHSGPIISKSYELSTAFAAASRLPMPPQALPRSYSIPVGGQVQVALRVPLEDSQNSQMAEDISSPPLTPISIPNIQPASPTS
ncbi:hypothetical protein BUALT_Bualt17G0012500 [Buddleja alternifolia]|uniref:Hydroxyproline-rich glycoprotein family protein n=1 Tax=Buddleja alternifolia TaxID=168488 RepID=A0AAV6WFZ4_9LAMI|nr:hypothetical protein BUALT_Bualt17G0012500 [Buddleja alternifolia]